MNILQVLRRQRLLYPLLSRARLTAGRSLMRMWHAVRGVDRDAVLFSSYVGKHYSDSPRRISEALHARRPELRILWQFRRGVVPADLPDYVQVVPARTLRAVRAYATVGCFVDNFNRPQYMLKFPDQIYVQTWHGDRGFKRVLLDMPGCDCCPDGEQMDLAVSGSRFASGVFRSAFGYKGEILEQGIPRNDLLLARPPEIAARTRASLGIPEGAKVLLYAPTFRDSTRFTNQRSAFSLARARAQLEQATGQRWVALSRGHDITGSLRAEGAIDAGAIEEVSELLLAVDLLITDYSSIGGDFMLLNRPVIYFQPDRGDYDAERGLYFDPDHSPLLVAHSEAELLALLSRPIDGEANCRACLEFFGCTETGRATDAVVDRILALMDARKANIIK